MSKIFSKCLGFLGLTVAFCFAEDLGSTATEPPSRPLVAEQRNYAVVDLAGLVPKTRTRSTEDRTLEPEAAASLAAGIQASGVVASDMDVVTDPRVDAAAAHKLVTSPLCSPGKSKSPPYGPTVREAYLRRLGFTPPGAARSPACSPVSAYSASGTLAEAGTKLPDLDLGAAALPHLAHAGEPMTLVAALQHH